MRRLLLASFATTIVACSDAPTVCPADLRLRFGPRDTTVTVNARFTMRFTLLGCAGTRVLSDSVTWNSSDPAVATVDAATGTVTAVGVGTAEITGSAFHYHRSDIARVTVRK